MHFVHLRRRDIYWFHWLSPEYVLGTAIDEHLPDNVPVMEPAAHHVAVAVRPRPPGAHEYCRDENCVEEALHLKHARLPCRGRYPSQCPTCLQKLPKRSGSHVLGACACGWSAK